MEELLLAIGEVSWLEYKAVTGRICSYTCSLIIDKLYAICGCFMYLTSTSVYCTYLTVMFL